MADIFVNKSGNDSFDGSVRVFVTGIIGPKKTLGGAIAIVSGGDTIFVGAGVYVESVIGPNAGGTYTIESDLDDAYGPVIFDGEGLIEDFWKRAVGGNPVNVRGLIVQNYFGSAFRNTNSSLTLALVEDLIIRNCGFAIRHIGTSVLNGTWRRIEISDCLIGIAENGTGTSVPVLFISQITFVGNGVAIDYRPTSGGAQRGLEVKNCIFRSNTIHLRVNANDIQNSNFNDIDFSSGKCVVQGVDKTSLVDYIAALTFAQDADSVSVDPVFVDEAKRLLRLDSASPLLSGIGAGAIQHAGVSGLETIGQSTNRNGADWSGAVLVGTILNANGDYELDGGVVGTVAPDVRDFGNPRRIRRVIPKVSINYPTEVADKDKTDESPNRPQFEFRGSNTVFLKGDALPAYSEAVIGEDLNVTFRFFQVRITLRADGVEA